MTTDINSLDPETLRMMKQRKKELQESEKEPSTNQELLEKLHQAGKEQRENKGKKLSFREVADILEQYAYFVVIGDTPEELDKSPLYWYDIDRGIYTKGTRNVNKLISAVENQLTSKQESEVLNKLRNESKEEKRTQNKNLIIVNNGVYDRQQDKLLSFSPDYVFTTKIATDYNSQAMREPEFNGWSVSKWFDDVADGNKDKKTLLWQIITASIDATTSHESAIFLIDDGQGRTGKSTFERLIMNLIGEENCGQLKLIEFEEDFKLALVDEKTVIIGDDNDPNSFNADSSKFKSLVTGETILINPKGTKPYYNRFNSLIIQSMNGMPRFKDSSDAHLRRFRIVKFNHQYPATPENRKIKDDYINRQELLEWLLYKALHSPKVTNFIQTGESENATEEIKEDNDAVYHFVNKYFNELESTRIPSNFLFNYFMACMDAENNHQQIAQRTFTKRIKPILEQLGWKYTTSRSLQPLNYWNGKDQQRLDNLRNDQRYLCNVDPKKYQFLFYKPH